MKTSNTQLDSPDRPPVLLSTIVVVGSFLFVYVFWFIAEGILSQVANKVAAETETGMGNTARLKYIKEQDAYLKSYKQLSDGNYKIPIDQAMLQVIQKDN